MAVPDKSERSLERLSALLASARCKQTRRAAADLCHRAQSIMCVANELENLGFQLSSNLCLDPGDELQRVLQHLNGNRDMRTLQRVLGRQYQKSSSLLIFTCALEVKRNLGGQLSLAGAADCLQSLSYCAMKPGPLSGCKTPVNRLTDYSECRNS